MADRLPATWTTRELPILREAVRRYEETLLQPVALEDIRAALGMDGTQVFIAVSELANAAYVDAHVTGEPGPEWAPGHILRVEERALRDVGLWPTADGLVAELAAALRQAAEDEPELERKSRLAAVADVLSGFARDVAVSVVARHVGG